MADNNSMKKETRHLRPLMMMLVAIVFLVVLMCSLSLAIIAYDQEGSMVNTIKTTDSITIMYTEGRSGINITNALPTKDSIGKELSGEGATFSFTVSAKLKSSNVRYEVTAIKDSSSTLEDDDVRLYLEKSVDNEIYLPVFGPSSFTPLKEQSSLGSPKGSMIIETGTFDKTQTNNYILRMWLKDNYNVDKDSKTYTVTVNVYAASNAS